PGPGAVPAVPKAVEAPFRARDGRRVREVLAQVRPRRPRLARVADLAGRVGVVRPVRVSGPTDDASGVALPEEARAVRADGPARAAVVAVELEVGARLVRRAARMAARASLARADAGLTRVAGRARVVVVARRAVQNGRVRARAGRGVARADVVALVRGEDADRLALPEADAAEAAIALRARGAVVARRPVGRGGVRARAGRG